MWIEGKKKKNKFNAKKTVVDGITFHSKKEGNRYKQLKLLENVGEIKDLHLQVRFNFSHNNVKICSYIADFTYTDTNTDEFIVEDVKGYITNIYKIKKQLMKAFYNIDIKET